MGDRQTSSKKEEEKNICNLIYPPLYSAPLTQLSIFLREKYMSERVSECWLSINFYIYIYIYIYIYLDETNKHHLKKRLNYYHEIEKEEIFIIQV